MDTEVSTWKSVIEDNKELKVVNPDLYKKIRELLLLEYANIEPDIFNECFESFVQNTFLYQGDLSLDNYEKIVAGEFFQALDNKDIYTSNSNKILRDIIDKVGKKSKTIITMPISYTSLVRKKGVSSEFFSKLKQVMSSSDSSLYYKIESELSNSLPPITYKLIIRLLKKHHQKLFDINDLLYQETTLNLENIIDEVLISNITDIGNVKVLLEHIKKKFKALKTIKHLDFNDLLAEAIFV